MHLLLVRHGETVDNVAFVYAGVTDSALTNHGVLQANRLGQHLADRISISQIFSSDLQRAYKTAEAIRIASKDAPAETVKVVELREKDFGSCEGVPYLARPRDSDKSGKEAHHEAYKSGIGFKAEETKAAMQSRADSFVDSHLRPLFELASDKTVVIVAHGIILIHLSRSILSRFPVSLMPGVLPDGQSQTLECIRIWSNTSVAELEIRENAAPLTPFEVAFKDNVPGTAAADDVLREDTITKAKTPAIGLQNKILIVKAINNLEHLKGLKKTRGGIGSSKHDEAQKSIESFFKNPKLG